jgi:flagellar FliL protein
MKKLILFVMLPLLLLIGAGLGALVAGLVPGVSIPGLGGGNEVVQEKDPGAPPTSKQSPVDASTYVLPEFVVNLQTNRTYPVFLLLSLAVEMTDEGVRPTMAAQEPRIRDAMIIYLSSLTPSDLNGYDGIQRVRDNAWLILQKFVPESDLVNVQVSKLTVK